MVKGSLCGSFWGRFDGGGGGGGGSVICSVVVDCALAAWAGVVNLIRTITDKPPALVREAALDEGGDWKLDLDG